MARRRAKGEGSIRKRSDGRWEGRYTAGRDPETGRLIYKNVLAKTQTECRSKLRVAIDGSRQEQLVSAATIQQVPEPPRKTYTVEEWLAAWYEFYAKPNLRETTREQYSNFIRNHLVPRIGAVPLDELTGLRLQQMYHALRTNGKYHQNRRGDPGLSPKTVRGIHMLLHSALEQAVKEGLLSKNPTNDCKPPRLEKKEMHVLQPEQVGAYLKAAADRNVLPMFYLELVSGLRRGELLALLWTDLNVEKRTISVNKSVLGRNGELVVSAPKTRHSIRTVTIPTHAVELLLSEHARHPDNPYMFPSPVTGTMYHPDAATRIHRKILKEAGIEPIRFHDLRHTFATLALQNGVDVKTLSQMLGHFSSGFTLDTYTHVTDRMQEQAAEKIGNFMEMAM